MWDINEMPIHDLHGSPGLAQGLVLLWSTEGRSERMVTRKQRAYENPNKDSKVSVSASLSGNGTCCVPGRTCSLKKETGLQSGDAGHSSWGYNVGRETD